MRKIILEEKEEATIGLDDIDETKPIFAKKDGELCGMIVKADAGWILRLGGNSGAYGYYMSLRACLERGRNYGYEFFIV